MAEASGADVLANTLLTSLIAGKNFSVPSVDLSDEIFQQPDTDNSFYDDITPITIDDLTTGTVGGSGVFDKLMASLVVHLRVEYEANRISGAEYTKAYIGVVGAALQTAHQFLLGKDQAYWQAILAQQQAQVAQAQVITARIQLEEARVGLVRTQFEASTAEANYALTKMKLSTEDVTYANLALQGEGIEYTNAYILPKQEVLLTEQGEVQRAQTLDTRSDAAPVAGAIGKQKDLYTQQITSYQRDAETKAAKMWVDAWITQKTIDEGLLAPDNFTNTELNEVLDTLKTNLNLGA